MHRFLFLPIILFLFLSCNPEWGGTCFTSLGKEITREINTDDFKNIEIYDLFYVYLQPDTVNKVVFKAGENILPKMKCEVKDSLLSIGDENYCDFLNPYDKIPEVTIHFKNLENLLCYGQCHIYSVDTIRGENISVQMKNKISYADLTFDTKVTNFQLWNTTGEYFLRGKTSYAYIINAGTGYLYAFDLKIQDEVFVRQESTGHSYTQSGKIMQVQMRNNGNLYYMGTPDSVNIERIGGSGDVIQFLAR